MNWFTRIKLIFVCSSLLFGGFVTISFGEKTPECSGLHIISSDSSSNSRRGYINCSGQQILAPIYEELFEFNEGVGVAVNDLGSIILNAKGRKLVLVGTYLRTKFSEGVAIGTKEGKHYIFNKAGHVVGELPDEVLDQKAPFFFTQHFSNGLAPVNTSHGIGFVNRSGKFVILPRFDTVTSFKLGRAAVETTGKWSLIDLAGRTVIPPIQNPEISIPELSEGLVVVRDSKKGWKYLDANGKVVLHVNYDYAGSFFDGLAQVNRGDTWGFINKRGEETISLKFQAVENFSQGRAAVKKSSKWGFVGRTGKWIIPPIFDDVLKSFHNGLAFCRVAGFEGYVDHRGAWIWKQPVK